MSIFGSSTCDKCGKKSYVLHTSVFDVYLMICTECYEKERNDPDFKNAVIALKDANDKNERFKGIRGK
jgi:hypothetical protein